ncbi:MAG: hypothetical protein ACWGQW_14925 [bacterium]
MKNRMKIKNKSIRKNVAARTYYRYVSEVERVLDKIDLKIRRLEEQARIPSEEGVSGRTWTFD